MKIRFFSIGLAWCVLVAGPVFADEVAVEGDAIPSMETIVVTAGRVPEKQKTLTNNVSVIDRETIEQSPATNVGELLKEQGLYVREYPGNLSSVGIRGFRTDTTGNDLTSKVLVLLDGRRAGTGNLAKIMTKNIERVEIVRGPASVQYGTSAVGGIVNVITRQGSGTPTAFVEGGFGSWRYEEASAGGQGEINGLDFSIAGTRSSMDDYDTADGEKYPNTGYDEKENLSLNVGYNFNASHRLGVIYTNFSVDEAGSPYYLSQNDTTSYLDKSNHSLDVMYTGGTDGGRFEWTMRYFSGKDKDKYVAPSYSYISDTVVDREGAQAQVSANFGTTTITGGMDWINYEIESTDTPTRSTYDNPAGFLLAKTRLLNERMILSAGGRYDQYEVEVKDGQGGKEEDDHFSPNVGVAYLVSQNIKLRANYGQAFVMPGANELAADITDHYTGARTVGNANLSPEKSTTWEGGIDFSISGVFASLTYFYTDFEDKIEQVTLSGGISSWENLGDSTISGIEGELNVDLGVLFDWTFELRPYLRFTYLTQYEDEETGEDLQYTPDWTASYGICFSNGMGLSAALNIAYTGEQEIEDWEDWDWMVSAEPEVITLGSSTVASLTISKILLASDRWGKLTLKGDITNLFNSDYAYAKGYPMPGRSYFLGLRYDI
ncbi:TonB-dependent receptor [uncultured Desulfosarcina sp.]|uniref:TonB-dependent receptor plug domain-containing protein n=1 Tax=uncultured Desulfosarcina sp. TaxID=218289 RepID=UPI0029C850CC|nr:TonB-dependent receptor [uncultured Desulfosarcina sp.]